MWKRIALGPVQPAIPRTAEDRNAMKSVTILAPVLWSIRYGKERQNPNADRSHQGRPVPRQRRPAFERTVDCHKCRRRFAGISGREKVSSCAAICPLPLRPIRQQALLRRFSREGRRRCISSCRFRIRFWATSCHRSSESPASWRPKWVSNKYWRREIKDRCLASSCPCGCRGWSKSPPTVPRAGISCDQTRSVAGIGRDRWFSSVLVAA